MCRSYSNTQVEVNRRKHKIFQRYQTNRLFLDGTFWRWSGNGTRIKLAWKKENTSRQGLDVLLISLFVSRQIHSGSVSYHPWLYAIQRGQTNPTLSSNISKYGNSNCMYLDINIEKHCGWKRVLGMHPRFNFFHFHAVLGNNIMLCTPFWKSCICIRHKHRHTARPWSIMILWKPCNGPVSWQKNENSDLPRAFIHFQGSLLLKILKGDHDHP